VIEGENKEENLIENKIIDLKNGRYLVCYLYEGEPTELEITIECQNE
jgi:hypothetical protein